MKAVVMVLLLSCAVLSWGRIRYPSRQQEIDEYEGEPEVEQLMCRDDGYHSIADKCYAFHQSSVSWEAARGICREEGGDLASVLDQAQYSGILGHINNNPNRNYPGTYWVSGQTSGGRWVWKSNDDRALNPEWWGTSPSTMAGQCAYFCSNTNKYWPSQCTNSKRFICQKTPTM